MPANRPGVELAKNYFHFPQFPASQALPLDFLRDLLHRLRFILDRIFSGDTLIIGCRVWGNFEGHHPTKSRILCSHTTKCSRLSLRVNTPRHSPGETVHSHTNTAHSPSATQTPQPFCGRRVSFCLGDRVSRILELLRWLPGFADMVARDWRPDGWAEGVGLQPIPPRNHSPRQAEWRPLEANGFVLPSTNHRLPPLGEVELVILVGPVSS